MITHTIKKKMIIGLCILTILIFKKVYCQSDIVHRETIDNYKSGIVFFNNYQFNRALEMFNLCYQKEAENISFLNKIAQCNYNLGKFEESKINYLKILEYDSLSIVARNQLGVIYLKESEYSKSIEQYKKLIIIDSTNSFYYKQIGFLSLKTDNTANAIQYLEKAHNLNHQDIEVIIELSDIYFKLNLWKKTENFIEKGLSLDSINTKLLLIKSKIAYKQKKYEAAISVINHILEFKNDTSIYMMKLLGTSYFYLKDYKKSVILMEKILPPEENPEIIHYYLGVAYRESGDLKKSLYHFQKAIEDGVSNNIPTYYTNLAITYEGLKNFKESIKAYQLAYKSSRNKILLYRLARVYDKFYKDKKTALQYYEKYLAMNDIENINFKEYSRNRVSELKEIIHFEESVPN
jgi:tetratricopeptide (TPR) repeat protein